MVWVIILLLFVIIALLLRINTKLPGRDLAQEAMDRYYKEKDEKERKERDAGIR